MNNKNKFTMELVWHNCLLCFPKEFKNDSLIATNGIEVFGMLWDRTEGYFISENECSLKRLTDLENWWWADIEQTVQGEKRFTN